MIIYMITKKEVIFDLETQKLFNEVKEGNPSLLGVSIVSIYERIIDNSYNELEGRLVSFWHNSLDQIWPIFQSADRIIGFNSIKFDVAVLQPYTKIPLLKFNHFDILEKVKESFGKRIRLDDIAKETLKKGKNDIGTNAVLYWKKGDPVSLKKLQKYCEMDVIITKEIYDFGLKNNTLHFKDKWNTPRQINVDFTYLNEDETTQQTALF